jgi:hypothetical protein
MVIFTTFVAPPWLRLVFKDSDAESESLAKTIE